jgi:hypothetical protein
MRKNLLFVAALMAGLSLSAGEVGKIDTLALGVSGTANPLTTGTVVAQTASVTMSIAFDDNTNQLLSLPTNSLLFLLMATNSLMVFKVLLIPKMQME